MKKTLLVAMMVLGLGATAMAQGNENVEAKNGYRHGRHEKRHNSDSHCGGHRGMGKGQHMGMRNRKLTDDQIKVQELKLAVMKEMNKETPDFKVIGDLNSQIADIHAKIKTERMKERFDAMMERENIEKKAKN